jgi:CheY-like chemotaxis protein
MLEGLEIVRAEAHRPQSPQRRKICSLALLPEGGLLQGQSLVQSPRVPLHAYGMSVALEETRKYCPPGGQLALAPVDARVLIVSEDFRSAGSLRGTLHDLGYRTVLVAYSAKRALVAAGEFSPSIVLLDLELPDMTGFQLATMLHAHARSHVRRVPLVAIAERPIWGGRERALAGGFIDCLTKPVLAPELNRLMHTLWD